MNQILKKICYLMQYASGVILFFICLIVVLNVLSRNIFNIPILGSNEIVQYGMMLAICLVLAQVTRNDGHVKVMLFVEKFPVKIQKIIAVFIDIIAFAGFAVFFYSIGGTALKAMSSGYVTSIFRIPMYLVDIVIMVGVGLMVLVLILKTFEKITNKGGNIPDSVGEKE